jgi:undecaprenyl phosphate-alpha-L-ara4N flippase subunit ArnE
MKNNIEPTNMSLVQFALIILTVFALSTGQILFKLAATSFTYNPNSIIASFLDMKLIIALLVYAVATVMWLMVLRSMPLRLAYPFVALAFFIVPIMAHYLLGEALNWKTFAGAALIGVGVWISILE